MSDLLYDAVRALDFRGKGRLRPFFPLPSGGIRDTRFRGGVRMRLDLSESLQRDYFFGLYDRLELSLVRRLLARGGDFVDVGAHVGLYAVTAALELRDRGRVLAFEPNPVARAQLVANVELNTCANVIVSPCAASDAEGRSLLFVPALEEPAWSTLEAQDRFEPGRPIEVETTTVDREVERHGLNPSLVKIDVEGHELRVFAGLARTLAERPRFSASWASPIRPPVEEQLVARGYRVLRIAGRRLVPASGLRASRGVFNALFVPAERIDELSGLRGVRL